MMTELLRGLGPISSLSSSRVLIIRRKLSSCFDVFVAVFMAPSLRMQRTTTASLRRLNPDSIMAHYANFLCAAAWLLHPPRRTYAVPSRGVGGLSKYLPTYSPARLVFWAHALWAHPAIPSNDLPTAG